MREERESVSNALFAIKIDQNRVEAAREKDKNDIAAREADIETLTEKIANYETSLKENVENVAALEAEIHDLETRRETRRR